MNSKSPATRPQPDGQLVNVLVGVTPNQFWKLALDETTAAQSLTFVSLDAGTLQSSTINTQSSVQWITETNRPLPRGFQLNPASPDTFQGVASVGLPMSQTEGDRLLAGFADEFANHPLIRSFVEPVNNHWAAVRMAAAPYAAKHHGINHLRLHGNSGETLGFTNAPMRNHFRSPSGDVYVIQHIGGHIQSVEAQTQIGTSIETTSIVSHSGAAMQRRFTGNTQEIRHMRSHEIDTLLAKVSDVLKNHFPRVAACISGFTHSTLQARKQIKTRVELGSGSELDPFSWQPAPFEIDRASYLRPGAGDVAYARMALPSFATETQPSQPLLNL